MSVPNEVTDVQVTLTALGQTIPTPFTFLQKDDLVVIKTVSDVDTTLTRITDYTVILPLELGQNGSVTMVTPAIGDIITITRCPDCTQETNLQENDRLPADVLEGTYDKNTMLACKAFAEIFGPNARVLKYPATEFGTNNVVPINKDRLGMLFGWDATTGAPVVIAPGSLDLALLLLADSDLGGATPDDTNGATQKAIRCALDFIITGAGLTAISGAYPSQAGKNFILLATDLNNADCLLDAAVQINKNAILSLDTRVGTLETDITNLTELISGRNVAASSATDSLNTAHSETLTTLKRISGDVRIIEQGAGSDSYPLSVRYTFVKLGGTWNWVIIGDTAHGNLAGSSNVAKGTGLVATLPAMAGGGFSGATADLALTISDNNILSAITFGAANQFEHTISGEVYS